MSYLRLKYTKFDLGWGSVPDAAVEAHSAPPDTPAGFKGSSSSLLRNTRQLQYIEDSGILLREGKGREGEDRGGEGEGRVKEEGGGGERKERREGKEGRKREGINLPHGRHKTLAALQYLSITKHLSCCALLPIVTNII